MAYGKITAKQKEILEYIKSEILKKGIRLQFVKFVRQLVSSLLLLFTHTWKHWKRMDIFEEIRPNLVQLKLWMTVFRWSDMR